MISKLSKTDKITRRIKAGYSLYRGEGFDGTPIVVIATMKSDNVKTGNMIQIWILRADVAPLDVIRQGLDKSICGTCPHASKQSGGDGTCYVNVGQAPRAVWEAYRNGNYPQWDGTNAQLDWLFSGRAVRFGAYGDPALIPVDLTGKIAARAKKWSGYTHAWTTNKAHSPYLMASVDSPREMENAKSHGWRTFRVGFNPQANEISCPASEEAGKLTTCERCGLCAGGERAAKDIVIAPHGRHVKRMSLKMA